MTTSDASGYESGIPSDRSHPHRNQGMLLLDGDEGSPSELLFRLLFLCSLLFWHPRTGWEKMEQAVCLSVALFLLGGRDLRVLELPAGPADGGGGHGLEPWDDASSSSSPSDSDRRRTKSVSRPSPPLLALSVFLNG